MSQKRNSSRITTSILSLRNILTLLFVLVISFCPTLLSWFNISQSPLLNKVNAAPTVETFTSSGTWQAPAGVTQVTVEVWGAGGGTGEVEAQASNKSSMGGGGGGAYAKSIVNVTSGTNYSYTVGLGANDTDGGDTYWVNSSTVMAKGGKAATIPTGGAGGTAADSVGTTKYSGGTGANGNLNTNNPPGGGGGGGAGSTGNGKDASGTSGGAATSEYGGAGGNGAAAAGSGEHGNNYGGGAGGGGRHGQNRADARAGGNGLVRITYTISSANRSPTFTNFQNNGPKNPGESITFTATASDPDGDNISLVVCQTQGISGTNCTGTTLCTSSSTSSNPSCQYQLPSILASGNYNAYPYVFDEKGEPANSTFQGALAIYSVNNMLPTVSNITLNSGDNITLQAGTTKEILITATVSDSNGYGDINTVQAYTYRSGVGYSGCDTLGKANPNHCYPEISCSPVIGTCQGASCNYTCSVNFQYYADPTDANTKYPTEVWLATIKAKDYNGVIGTQQLSQGVKVGSLLAFNITTEIDYGSLDVGGSNDPLDRTTTITPTGNVGLDHEVYGPSNMCTDFPLCYGGKIAVGYQRYALKESTTYTSATSLSTTETTVYTNVPKVTSLPPVTRSIWWGILVPEETGAGTYDGEITIVGMKSNVLNW